MKDRIFGVLQRIGRSFMLPIAILPVAGLLLGIGSTFTNETTIETYGLQHALGEGTVLHALFVIMNEVGNAVFDNLPILFAVGVAIGMAKREREVAALSAVIAYFVMNTAINGMLLLNGEILEDGTIASDVLSGTITSSCGILTLQTGVFGGIIVGPGVAALHNRFYKIKLPNALSFFGGTRFVPIISTLVYMLVGIALYFVWPPVQNGIYALGGFVTGSGYWGTLVFGLIKRALIPFGLHHVFYMPFWQTAVGGTMEVAGQIVEGGQNIFFAQLADSANVTHFSADATRYFSGEFIFMIFGLPGAALAMYRCARPEKKKQAGGLLLSASLASMLTGITEPIEFSFLFVAPLLFVVQVVLAGTAYMVAHMLNIAVGLTFSGGLLDFLLFGVLQGNAKTSWLLVIPVGLVYFALYYGIFRFLIKKLDLKTPGREEDGELVRLYGKADVQEKRSRGEKDAAGEGNTSDRQSAMIVRGLGGKGNILDVDCCATRLRCAVADKEKVDTALLKRTGASGVLQRGGNIQIIYGPQVTGIKSHLEEYLETDIPEVEEIEETEETDAAQTDAADVCAEKKAAAQTEASARAEKSDVRTVTICSPFTGRVHALFNVPDDAFSKGLTGQGAAVEPEKPLVVAPDDGEVTFVFATGHALGFLTESGVPLLIHVGVDTVKLKGKGFTVLVKEGQRVKCGDRLIRMELPYLRKHAPSMYSPVVCTEVEDASAVRLLPKKYVHAGEPLYEVEV